MYLWRQLTTDQRNDLIEDRRRNKLPWHSPPHYKSDKTDRYLFTAACYEHKPHIGHSPERMAALEKALVELADERLVAWVVLPNHYHVLAITRDPFHVLAQPGKLHGRTSFEWNSVEDARGRKVWSGAAETAMKSARHFWATMNYIHHNPVKHGYAEHWQDWPYSSVHQYLEQTGCKEAERIWKNYPVNDYGKTWDIF